MLALLVAAVLAGAPQRVPLEVLSVDIDRRVLTVARESGPCWPGEPDELQLEESAGAYRFRLLQERVEGCSGPVTYTKFRVRLRHWLAGRRFEGGPRIAGRPLGLRRRSAPRVIDFDPGDARRSLAIQGFRARRLGRAGDTVAFQSPLPGRRAAAGVVRLTLGRDLFRTRALERCLERSGIGTAPRRPRPGDFDAPDLVLWLQEAPAYGSVALYRDPVRAAELAPVVRRQITRVGGFFERTRRVSFAWATKPPPGLRARVRACVLGPLGRPTT